MKYFLKRACAYLIEGTICYALVMLIIQWAILSNIRPLFGITDEWFENSFNLELYILLTISLPVWGYFIYYDSNKAKGTFGKRIFKLSVFDEEKKRIGLRKSFLRTLFKLSPWEIAHLGVVFPVPMYFAAESPDVRLLTIVGMLLFFAYIISILVSPGGLSIYDKIIGTKVGSSIP